MTYWNKYKKLMQFCSLSHLAFLHRQPPEVLYEKDVVRNFAKFTGKHLCQSIFFNKVAGLRPKFSSV